MLKEKLDAAGVENVLQTAGDGSDPQAMWEFLVKHLKPDAVSSEKYRHLDRRLVKWKTRSGLASSVTEYEFGALRIEGRKKQKQKQKAPLSAPDD